MATVGSRIERFLSRMATGLLLLAFTNCLLALAGPLLALFARLLAHIVHLHADRIIFPKVSSCLFIMQKTASFRKRLT